MKRFACVLLLLTLLASFIPTFAQEVVVDAVLDSQLVIDVQNDLIGKGYLSGEADGVLGGATVEAIRAAQADLGMEANGLLTDEFAKRLAETRFPLRVGARNEYVRALQERLYLWGYMEEEPSGYYGRATQDAVISFQELALNDFTARLQSEADEAAETQEVPDDVVIDQPLYNATTVPCDGVMTEEWYNFLFDEYKFPHITAKLDDNNSNVKLMQKRLHALGYLYSGMDGSFGSVTELALKYFQRKNGLKETGRCDDATSDALFSDSAVESDEYVMPYAARVERSKSRVYIYAWDGSGYNTKVKTFKCSCGARATPTIKGTFYCTGPISEWYYMKSSAVWVRYAFQIQGNYFFHSVLFKSKGAKHPTSTSVHNLGKNVSHGCIRLSVEDCKWIYDNCTQGMKVVIE